MTQIRIKRIYEPVKPGDGFRILVDRLWPRGIKKENARIDVWLKEIAPSTDLRKWFNHEPEKWNEFRKAYRKELRQSGAVKELMEYARANEKITLLYSAKDEAHNQAVALMELIKKMIAGTKT